ncbi:bifunctional DedA family/phosphatase PAP2 family protein [Motiliproteus sp.]|uniref:bifunctional DedA family/phosphatase PAP2 family protein n=1 Tax=Motiliproteus sp. TaxID=1898955 RepID=UPI003BA9965C
MSETLSILIDWLDQHPHWTLMAIGLSAFVESLALIGVIVPGVAVLYALALLAGSAELNLTLCLLAAMLGAIAGDLLSFALGRYAHQPALRHWPFNRYPDWVTRGEQFFQRYGGYSVAIGRFVGPIRPVLPFVAGMLQMAPPRFIAINLASALLWAPLYILPGYLLGKLGRETLPELSNLGGNGMLNLLLLGLLLLIPLVAFGLHRWLHPAHPHHRRLGRSLQLEPLRSPRSHELPLASALLAGVALIGFALLSLSVVLGNPLAPLDLGLHQLSQLLRTDMLDHGFITITLLGDGWLLGGLCLVIALSLTAQQQRIAALHWLVAILAVLSLNTLAKNGFVTERPQVLLEPLHSYSFPSGHTSATTLWYSLLAAFIAQHWPYRRRWLCYAATLLPISAVAMSRLYLGVHWFSDIVGGLLLGLTVAGLIRLSYSRFDRQPIRWPVWLWPLLLLCIAGYIGLRFEHALQLYQIAAS